jgi:1,4-dihydroxy-2-naphthoate polyprenyltransferase
VACFSLIMQIDYGAMSDENEEIIAKPPPGKLLSWIRAIGFFRGFLIISLMPVSLGAMIAHRTGIQINMLLFSLSLVGVWCFHAGTNLLNDYYDHVSKTDDINKIRTPFSGGTRVIQDGLLNAKSIRNAAWTFYALGIPAFVYIGIQKGPVVFILAGLGMLSGILYTMKPVWLSYRGVGELMICLSFGPMLVAFGMYVQAGFISLAAWLVGAVIGLWVMAVVTVNEIPDFEADKQVGKRNLVVILGTEAGAYIWTGLLWTSVALLLAGLLAGILPQRVVVALPMVFAVLILTRKPLDLLNDLDSLVTACQWTIITLIAMWALLMIGFYISPVGKG